MKVSFKRIAHSLADDSVPVFGVSFKPSEAEREIVRKLIAFLEDHRVLYNPFDIEMPQYVEQSITEIRRELTGILETLDDDSEISQHVRAMRLACREFLKQMIPDSQRRHKVRGDAEFATALAKLRTTFGIHLAQLCVKYGIDVEEELAVILPNLGDE
jgi:hypothetical protein